MCTLRRLAGLVLALALTGCSDDGSQRASDGDAVQAMTTAPETVRVAPPPAVPRRLARAPAGCRGGAPTRERVAPYGQLLGRSPVWAGVYASWDARGRAFHLDPDSPRTERGWQVKILWIVAPTQTRPVRLSGARVPHGTPVSFEVEDGPGPTARGVLDPAEPDVPATRPNAHREFPSYAFFPGAGCYLLQANWGTGAWRLVVGVGL